MRNFSPTLSKGATRQQSLFRYILNFLVQELYIRVYDWAFFKDFIQPIFTRESFNWEGTKAFLKLGVPGTLMQCAEWWAFELLAIFSGMLG